MFNVFKHLSGQPWKTGSHSGMGETAKTKCLSIESFSRACMITTVRHGIAYTMSPDRCEKFGRPEVYWYSTMKAQRVHEKYRPAIASTLALVAHFAPSV
jgi:hypothetical protein